MAVLAGVAGRPDRHRIARRRHGGAWLLDEAGVSVPWRIIPSAALILVGLALTARLLGGRGRGVLVGLGIALMVVAIAIGVERTATPGRWETGC